VDVWAGLVLRGKQFLPLARELFSSRHPAATSQNRAEEAALGQALGLLGRVGLQAIVVADRGQGRKELLVGLAGQRQDFVIRIDADIVALVPGAPRPLPLAALLERQPWLGACDWDRGQEGPPRCRARALRATIRHSRSGRQAGYQEATLAFVQLVPTEGGHDPLVLATTLPVGSRAEAKGVAAVYAQRWSIESGFETLKAWGLGRFRVRAWDAIDRLLWIVATAYLLAALLLRHPALRAFRQRAITLLTQLSVLGRHLTVGKLAEAIALDAASPPPGPLPSGAT
jgi:hypothetical protein